MVREVEIWEDEARTGSFLLAQGLEREHKIVRDLVEKYRLDFEDFSSVKKRKLRSTGGRAANEYLLTFEQTLFLISLLRNNRTTVKLMSGVIKGQDIVSAFKAIKNFDVDGVNVRYVYAAVDPRGRVKIGISNDPQRRVTELNSGNADTLQLVYTKRADKPGYQSEVELHKKCETYRIKREWFESGSMEVINGK